MLDKYFKHNNMQNYHLIERTLNRMTYEDRCILLMREANFRKSFRKASGWHTTQNPITLRNTYWLNLNL